MSTQSTTQPKTTRNPNQKTVRHLRVPDDLWNAACEKADADGLRPAEMFRAMLRAYVAGRIDI